MLIDPVYSFHCISLRIPDTIPPEDTPGNALSRAALIQATLWESSDAPIEKIKHAMIDKHVALLAEAAGQGAQVVYSHTVPSQLHQ